MEKEKKLNISAIQMCSKVGDKKANFEKVSDLILRDITSETDVIVLPVLLVGRKTFYVKANKKLTAAKLLIFFPKLQKNIIAGLSEEALSKKTMQEIIIIPVL